MVSRSEKSLNVGDDYVEKYVYNRQTFLYIRHFTSQSEVNFRIVQNLFNRISMNICKNSVTKLLHKYYTLVLITSKLTAEK